MRDRFDFVLAAAGVILVAASLFSAFEAWPSGPGPAALAGGPPLTGGLVLCWLSLRQGPPDEGDR
jgi:hypothetical protein